MESQPTAIRTRPYVLEEQPIMGIIRGQLLKQQLFMAAIFVLAFFVVLLAESGHGLNPQGSICVGIAMTFLAAREIYRYSGRVTQYRRTLNDAGWFAVPRWNEIDENFFAISLSNSEFNKVKLEGLFKKVELLHGYYLLRYAAVKQMTFIPVNAFESSDDRQRFEQLLADKGVPVVHK